MKNKQIMFLFLLNLIVGLGIRWFQLGQPWRLVSDVLLISVFVFVLILNYKLKDHAEFGSKNIGFWLISVVSIAAIIWFSKSLLGL